MTMFDFLDTKAVTEPTVVDMSDVEEIEEEEVTAKEYIPENHRLFLCYPILHENTSNQHKR